MIGKRELDIINDAFDYGQEIIIVKTDGTQIQGIPTGKLVRVGDELGSDGISVDTANGKLTLTWDQIESIHGA